MTMWQIILLLLIGGLIAWIVEWFLDRQHWQAHRQRLVTTRDLVALKESIRSLESQVQALSEVVKSRIPAPDMRSELAAKDAEIRQLREQLERLQATRAESQERALKAATEELREQLQARDREIAELKQQLATAGDDLTRIRGIGKVYAQALKRAGVRSFEDLARLSPKQVKELISDHATGRVNVEEWIAQARELAAQRASAEH